MNWFKKISKMMKKTASKTDAKNRALQQLQQGFDPFEVATDFTEEMSRIDPYFSYSDHGRSVSNSAGDSDSLMQAINSIPNDNETVIPTSITQQQQQQFNFQQRDPIDAVFEEKRDEDINVQEPTLENSDTENNAEDDTEDDTEENAVVSEEEIQVENDLELNTKPKTEEEEKDEAYRDAIEIDKNVYVRNPLSEREFSIPKEKLASLMKGFRKLNETKEKMNLAPMKINWLDGVDEKGKPNSFIKIIKAKDGKTELPIDFIKFSIEGDIPNPYAASQKKVRNPNTRKVVELKPVIYQVIGMLRADTIEGYDAKEKPFDTYEDALAFVERSNAALPEKDRLWIAKENPKKYSLTEIEKDPTKKDKKYYPAIYTGHWRSLFESYSDIPINEGLKTEFKGIVKDKFLNSGARCDHCSTEKNGPIARKHVYVAIEYPESMLPMVDDGNGNQVRQEPTEEQMKNGVQVQVGTGCISGHKKALDFFKNLEKIKLSTKKLAGFGGKRADFFGGSKGSPKSLRQVLASYIMGSRSNNWYSRTLLDRIKSYYFGTLRDKINKEQRMLPEPWGDPDAAAINEANTIIDWWKSKDGQPEYDSIKSYGNLIGLALIGRIRTGQLKFLPELARTYSYLKRQEDRKNNNPYNNLSRMTGGIAPVSNPIAEPVVTNPEPVVTDTEPVNRTVVMKDIREGERFTGKFKYSYSNKFNGGAYHILKDPTGQKISIKDIYRNGRPNFRFELRNDPYEISGTKGRTDRYYNTVTIDDARLVGSDEVAPEDPANTPATPRAVQGGTRLQEKLHDVNRQPIYYFTGDSFTFNNREELKRMGFVWWGGGRMWWIFKRDLPATRIQQLSNIGFDTSIINEQV